MAQPIAIIVEKLQSKDKDYRYMATSDLQGALEQSSFKTDDQTERTLARLILQQLEDPSGDISSLAVKCLALLVQRVSTAHVEDLVDSLCSKLLSGKREQERDVAAIGLKTVVTDLPGGALATLVVRRLCPKLVAGVQQKESYDIVSASLDLMNEVVSKFGGLVAAEHARICDCLLPELDESRAGVRKRAIHCLSALAPHLTDALLDGVVKHLLQRLQAPHSRPEAARTHMQSLAAMSRAAGWRFGKHLGHAVPLVLEQCGEPSARDEELREHCLQALDAFVLRSPHDARGALPQILPIVLQCLAHDPNCEDDMDAEDGSGGEEDDEELTDEEYSDDEDVSWKVRRAAAKCLATIVSAFPDRFSDIYARACPALLARFREREESVKIDVFQAFIALLRQASVAARREGGGAAEAAAKQRLRADVPSIAKAVARTLREKSVKARAAGFALLKALVAVQPAPTNAACALLLLGVLAALSDRSSSSAQLKLHALQFVREALSADGAAAWRPHLAALAPPVAAAASERYYKVGAEALRACAAMCRVIRPDAPAPVPADLQKLVPQLHAAVAARLRCQDQDQEVKECAIAAAATLAAHLGDLLPRELPDLLQALQERLRNEMTRLAGVKAVAQVASSRLDLDLGAVLEPVLAELTAFLRKASRPLRQAALAAIEAVVAARGARMSAGAVDSMVEAAAPLVSDGDLAVSALALHACSRLLERQPASARAVTARVLPQAIALAQSPLLQGQALEALLAFFSTVLRCAAAPGAAAPGASFDALLAALLAAGTAPAAGRSAQHNIAQCIAVLCSEAGPATLAATVEGLLSQLQAPRASEAAKRLALLAIGEIGRSADLSRYGVLRGALTSALKGGSEEVKAAASVALGGVALGNMSAYLPFILSQISEQARSPKDQYLLLKALNEVIVSLARSASAQLSAQHQQEVLRLLLAHCGSEEECRNVVAECLGHLALLHTGQVLPPLQAQAGATSPSARAAVVTAVKSMLLPQPHAIDPLLRDAIPGFLTLVSDPDRHVRKAAVQMLSSAAHNKPWLVADQLEGVLPRLYAQTAVDESLIRTVDLGPFKHRIDDGLELRKAAFECVDILVDACPDRLSYPAFLTHLESGLKDHYDVKMPCHILLAKLATVASEHVLAHLERLVPPLEATLATKVKSDAVKQEVDRNDDMLRSCLRAVDALNRIPNASSCAPFQRFIDGLVAGPLAVRYAAVKAERAEAEGAAPDGMDAV
ncbi:hypothetical protein WJX81_005880 [Elliptochloris bilobata]|uniref:TATA-binding protein interacting (TIP20) domain-containing protein n=1 Tax=Elliptochloris bilobata TaxID=381761 RepID=A0AAW1RN80_9CHLO